MSRLQGDGLGEKVDRPSGLPSTERHNRQIAVCDWPFWLKRKQGFDCTQCASPDGTEAGPQPATLRTDEIYVCRGNAVRRVRVAFNALFALWVGANAIRP